MKHRNLQRLLSLALSLLLLLSLTPPVRAEGETEETPQYTVTLDQTAAVIETGDLIKVTATAKGPDGDPVDAGKVAWSWTCSNATALSTAGKNTATCSARGKAATAADTPAVLTATATITLDGGDTATATASCAVTVNEPAVPVTVVTIGGNSSDPMEVNSKTDGVRTFVAGLTGADPDDPTNPATPTRYTLSWTSSDPSVATVAPDSTDPKIVQVTAVGPGVATITVKATNASGEVHPTASVVVEVSGVKLSPASLELVVGRGETLTYSQYGNAKNKTLIWASSNISVAEVRDGQIYTYNPGSTVVSLAAGSYSATCSLTVKEDVAARIDRTLAAGKNLAFKDLVSALQGVAADKLVGSGLEYITNLSVLPSQGTLYYGYSSPDLPGSGVGSKERYYISKSGTQRLLSDVTFVPAGGFSGAADITYSGFGGGQVFNGTIRLTVQGTGDVTLQTAEDVPLTFEARDFSAVCTARTGRSLRSVSFQQPAVSRGALYHNYSRTGQYSQKVTAGTPYYVSGGSRQLEEVTFVPAEGFTGTVAIPYTATDSAGVSYSGQVTVTVYATDGSGGTGDILYYGSAGKPVDFNTNDFNNASLRRTGAYLDYVYFTLPGSDKGVLYHGGSAASASTRYFHSRTPSISNVEFVPAAGFSGTVDIPFTGYNTAGRSFAGTVSVRVSGEGDSIRYSTAQGVAVRFDGLDFNEACTATNGSALNYISFTLPDAVRGALYTDYTYWGTGTTRRAVTATDSFNKTTLSGVTFQPAGGFTGTVAISFTGSDVAGNVFGGVVEVEVGRTFQSGVYYTGSSLPISFRAEDFRQATALPGALVSVRFTSLPSAAQGRLLMNYHAVGLEPEYVRSGEDYFTTGNVSLENITFLARAGYQGTVSIPYAAKDVQGNTVSGTARIQVADRYLDRSFTDTGKHAWAEPSIEFLCDSGVIKGTGGSKYTPAGALSRADYVLMLHRTFNFTERSGKSYSDVPKGSYYEKAVVTARALGILSSSQRRFGPAVNVTRQEAVELLAKAMQAAGRELPEASLSLLNNYGDGGKVGTQAQSAMAAMIELGVITGDNYGNLNPQQKLTRAEIAVILHRLLTL